MEHPEASAGRQPAAKPFPLLHHLTWTFLHLRIIGRAILSAACWTSRLGHGPILWWLLNTTFTISHFNHLNPFLPSSRSSPASTSLIRDPSIPAERLVGKIPRQSRSLPYPISRSPSCHSPISSLWFLSLGHRRSFRLPNDPDMMDASDISSSRRPVSHCACLGAWLCLGQHDHKSFSFSCSSNHGGSLCQLFDASTTLGNLLL